MIRALTKPVFDSSPEYDYLKDIKPPVCFNFVYYVFNEIYSYSKESITWQDISAYMSCRDIRLKQIEIDYIMKCNRWAIESISSLKKEEE